MTEFKINEKFENLMKKELKEMNAEEREFHRTHLLEISRYFNEKSNAHWNENPLEQIKAWKEHGVCI